MYRISQNAKVSVNHTRFSYLFWQLPIACSKTTKIFFTHEISILCNNYVIIMKSCGGGFKFQSLSSEILIILDRKRKATIFNA